MESFWLCDDCLFAAAYEDYSTLSLYYTTDEIEKRIADIHRPTCRRKTAPPLNWYKSSVGEGARGVRLDQWHFGTWIKSASARTAS
ncbi:hypothetical protein FBY10_11516 [Pseudomonas sp. SJZ103]|uniref:hypothetical protein n=1 Tax=unclassified Pseudomonas TaxID=196821 RepID=UPI00119E0DCC|nr:MULTISPECIES: hypothetical protein [unclassified Pseudomonas]TWC62998.1 hypothetical protein FBY10_11516 [Pseudomonas sp. SJZ103]TWC80313.1 hypothetical protein FBY08_116162 [Pseudomonas sp. SJZ094]